MASAPASSLPADAVLVVEDNPITRKMIRVTLEVAGYRVIEAEDAADALRAVASERPSLILQDLVLPDRDGLDLVTELRDGPAGHDTPILAITGYLARMGDPRFACFNDVIIKPIEPSRLTEIIRGYLPPVVTRTSQGGGRRVMVVDDDPVQLRLQRAALTSMGFEVEVATSAEAALAAACLRPPHAILSDVLMPDVDGFTLCLQARREPRLAGVPVVLATARAPEPADVELARQAGANGLVQRTPGLEGVVAALVSALESGPQSEPETAASGASDDHRRRLLRQLERQAGANEELARLCSVQGTLLASIASLSSAMGRRGNLQDALDEVLYALVDISGASRGAFFLMSPEGRLSLAAALGFGDSQRDGLTDLFGHGEMLHRVMRDTRLLTAPSEELDPDASANLLDSLGARAAMVVPLVARGEPVGALVLGSNLATLREREWQTFARTVGVQLGHALALTRSIEQLTASERRYRTLLEQADDAIFLLSGDGLIVEANAQAEALTGCARERLVRLPFTHFTPAEHRDSVIRALTEIRRNGHGRSGRERVLRADAETALIEFSGRVVEIGEETLIFLIVRDLTERDRLEQQLRQAQKMEALGQLTGGVAHDFNNLLTAILGYAELALEGSSEHDSRRRDLEQIIQVGHSAAALTRQLLAFSRQQVLQPVVVDLNAVLVKLAPLLRSAIGADIELRVAALADVPSIVADPGQLEQVLLNLAVNARDAMPRGGVLAIQTALVNGPADNREIVAGLYVQLSVTDTGCGMTPAVRARIFEPFFTTKEVGKGTGLGLATVYGIVKQSGGQIAVDSEPGRGTTFKICFPSAPREQAEAPLSAPTAHAVERTSGRILLVEDAAPVRELARDVLRARGYEVFDAAGPDDAWVLTERIGAIDLLLTDVVLPGMNGWDFAAKVKIGRPALKVLFMSGYTGQTSRRSRGLQPGEAFLEKPFMPHELSQRVDELLRQL